MSEQSFCFLGDSHAAHHLREAARSRGFVISTDPAEASVTFVSQDAGIDPDGSRDLGKIQEYLGQAMEVSQAVVLTSQVPPGFTRAHKREGVMLYHQAETLRMKDAKERAMNPDYIVIGAELPQAWLPSAYWVYAMSFDCPVIRCTYEEAEFSKIAVNMTLASQVDNTNRLAAAARKCGADWDVITMVLSRDKRIGPESYLTPGRWQDSLHLLRDYVTLEEIRNWEPPLPVTRWRFK